MAGGRVDGETGEARVPSAGMRRAGDGGVEFWVVRDLHAPETATPEAEVIVLRASPEAVCGVGGRLPYDGRLAAAVEARFDDIRRTLDADSTGQDRRRMGSHFVSWFGMLSRGSALGFDEALDGSGPSRREVFRAFADVLDPALVETVGLGNGRGAKPYDLRDDVLALCWPGLDRTLSPDGALREAFAVLPGLEALAADAWVEDPSVFREAARSGRAKRHVAERTVERGILPARLLPAAIDFARAMADMEPLPSAMAARKQPTPADVATYDMSPWHCLAVDAVRRLVPMPASWVPSGPAEWQAFAALCPVIDRYVAMGVEGNGWSALLNNGGRWADQVTRLDALHARWGELKDAASTGGADMGLDDMARAYAVQVLAPVVAAASDGTVTPTARGWDRWTDAARSLLFSGRSLARQVEASVSWHRGQYRIGAAISDMAGPGMDPLAWPAGLPDATYGDVAIRVLTDERQLLAEGAYGVGDGERGLGHCVGGYGVACRSEGARILSLRLVRPDGSFERLSTARVSAVGGRIDVEEHRGRGNGPSPQAAVTALGRYVDDVASGRLAADHDALAAMPDVAPLAACGYDAADPASRAAVAGMWRAYLPGTVSAMDEATLAAFAHSLVGKARWRPAPFGSPSDDVPEPPWAHAYAPASP